MYLTEHVRHVVDTLYVRVCAKWQSLSLVILVNIRLVLDKKYKNMII